MIDSLEQIGPPWFFITGYSLFVACFFFKDVLYLRTLALVGQLALVPYYIKDLSSIDISLSFTGLSEYLGIVCTLLVVSINLVFIYILLRERRPVELTTEQRSLYEISFSSLSMRNFHRLFTLGEIETPEQGELLIGKGRRTDSLYLVIDGEFQVVLESGQTRTIGKGGFIGELSFISGEVASADVSPLVSGSKILCWDKFTLVRFLDKDPVLSNAFDLIISSDVANKLKRMTADSRLPGSI